MPRRRYSRCVSKMISYVCDFECLCACVCPRCKRKTTRAINTKLGTHTQWQDLDIRWLRGQKVKGHGHRVMKHTAGFGMPMFLVIISRVAIQSIERKRVFLRVCRLSPLSVCLSVCLCVREVYVSKRLIGSGCRLGWWVGSVERWVY